MSDTLSRRGFFAALRRPFERKPVPAAPPAAETAQAAAPGPRTAVIQARFCLALTSFCSACLERCPVPGAMRSERGLPWVIADTCTGCGVCQEVCPAPRNAVLLLPRRQPPLPQPA